VHCPDLGIFFSSSAMQALCVTCTMHFSLLEAGLTILHSVPGVVCSLRSSFLHISLGSTWMSVYTRLYMTVSWFLLWPSFLVCADFSRIYSIPLHDKLPNLLDCKAWICHFFMCSHALHHLISSFTGVNTIVTMHIISLVWMHMTQCILGSLIPFLIQDIFALACIY